MIGTFKRFTMKWANRCSECGRRLDPGMIGWGQKDDLNNKWVFLCDSCYQGTNDPNVKGVPSGTSTAAISDGDVSDLLEIVDGDMMAKQVEGVLDGKSKTSFGQMLKPPKRTPTILELIKRNAPYGGV